MTSSSAGQVPCPMCGSDNDSSSTTCTVCGYDLSSSHNNAGGSKCARCGSQVPVGYAFCPVCGLDQRARHARPPTRLVQASAEEAAAAAEQVPAASPQPVAPSSSGPMPYPQEHHGRSHTEYYGGSPHPGPYGPPGHPQPSPPYPGAPHPAPGYPQPAYPQAAPQHHGHHAPPYEPEPPPPMAPAGPPSAPAAQTGRTVFVDGPPLPRPPEFDDDSRTVPVPSRRPKPVADEPAPPEPPPAVDSFVTARLVLVGRDGEEGESFSVPPAGVQIGRLEGDIRFGDDPFMSPRHARLERDGDVFRVLDAGSTNGIYLRIRDQSPVYPGDHFMVGHQVLRLENVTEQVQESSPSGDGTRVFGTPLKPAWGKLVLVGRGQVTGDTYFLRGAKVIFGREQGDILFPQDPFVSREHARLRLELHGHQMSVFLEDLGSANGTYIRIRGRADLEPKDTFRVGDQILRLHVDR